MHLLYLSAVLIWNVVFAYHMLANWQLLLRIVHWSLSIWLLIFGFLAARVLHSGLPVYGHVYSREWAYLELAWMIWYAMIIDSVFHWRYLVPSVAVLLMLVMHPEMRVLGQYGLVKLRWLDAVYNPVSFAKWKLSRELQFAALRHLHDTYGFPGTKLLLQWAEAYKRQADAWRR
ncbi:hypothetical protein F5Y17DRAFT_377483 [Xylariaceae sp. FL0594]|nr:hypothetical protein F5Y17DRAFT_377483 [Xylariaceae sp. FL0594]